MVEEGSSEIRREPFSFGQAQTMLGFFETVAAELEQGKGAVRAQDLRKQLATASGHDADEYAQLASLLEQGDAAGVGQWIATQMQRVPSQLRTTINLDKSSGLGRLLHQAPTSEPTAAAKTDEHVAAVEHLTPAERALIEAAADALRPLNDQFEHYEHIEAAIEADLEPLRRELGERYDRETTLGEIIRIVQSIDPNQLPTDGVTPAPWPDIHHWRLAKDIQLSPQLAEHLGAAHWGSLGVGVRFESAQQRFIIHRIAGDWKDWHIDARTRQPIGREVRVLDDELQPLTDDEQRWWDERSIDFEILFRLFQHPAIPHASGSIAREDGITISIDDDKPGEVSVTVPTDGSDWFSVRSDGTASVKDLDEGFVPRETKIDDLDWPLTITTKYAAPQVQQIYHERSEEAAGPMSTINRKVWTTLKALESVLEPAALSTLTEPLRPGLQPSEMRGYSLGLTHKKVPEPVRSAIAAVLAERGIGQINPEGEGFAGLQKAVAREIDRILTLQKRRKPDDAAALLATLHTTLRSVGLPLELFWESHRIPWRLEEASKLASSSAELSPFFAKQLAAFRTENAVQVQSAAPAADESSTLG